MKKHRFFRTSLLCMCTLYLGGCGNNDLTDLETYVAEVKAKQKSYIEPLPEIKQAETFAFNPEGVRDPFAPTEGIDSESGKGAGNGLKPDENRRKEELEGYPLDSLRMVGTLMRKSTLKGLIRSRDGKIYSVTPGNYMGQNYGRIVRITGNRMELVELVPDGSGGWQERQAALALSD